MLMKMLNLSSYGRRLSSTWWHSPLSRGQFNNTTPLVKSRVSDQCGISSMQTTSTSQPMSVPGQPSKVYVRHNFFKGKAALRMQPVAPVFSTLDTRAGLKLSKTGTVMLSFAPAVASKTYDWSKKEMFALAATEIGSFLSLGPNESLEFYHDPFMGKSDAGKVRKILQVSSKPNNEGYLFKLSVSNKLENLDVSMVVPITNGEFALMRTTFTFILPYIMGWHAFTNFTESGQSSHITSGKPNPDVAN